MENNRAPDGEDRRQKCHQAAGMEERREDRTDVPAFELPAAGGVEGVPRDHPMRQHHALRLPRRARGVEEAVGVLGMAMLALEPGWLEARDEVGVDVISGSAWIIQGDPLLEFDRTAKSRHRLCERAVVEQGAKPGVVHDVRELGGRQPRAERDENDPRLAGREEGVEILDPVVRENPDTVAFREAQVLAPEAGAAHRPVVELAIRPASASGHFDKSRLVRGEASSLAQEIGVDHPAASSGAVSTSAVAGGSSARISFRWWANASGHSYCGMWPQRSMVVKRARGSSAAIRSA